MQSQNKPGSMDVGGPGRNAKVVDSSRRVFRSWDVVLRVLGLLLTLLSAILTGLDKEKKIVSITIVDSLPPLQVPATAKWQYMSAFVYFLACNAIACSYTAASLVFAMAGGNSKDSTALALVILDLMMTGLLFSANGAAIAVGVLGRYGNSHVKWRKVCDAFGGFCHQMTASAILSLLGSFVFLWLVALAVLKLHKRSG